MLLTCYEAPGLADGRSWRQSVLVTRYGSDLHASTGVTAAAAQAPTPFTQVVVLLAVDLDQLSHMWCHAYASWWGFWKSRRTREPTSSRRADLPQRAVGIGGASSGSDEPG